MQQNMKDLIAYSSSLILSLVLILWIIPNNMPEYPGYGVPASLVPEMASYFMLVLSTIGLIRIYIGSRKDENRKNFTFSFSPKNYYLFVFIMVCILFLLALPYVGFIISGIVLLLLLQIICKQRKPVPLILVSVLPVLFMYVLMRFVLNVPIP